MTNTQLRWNARVADLRKETGMIQGEVCVLQGYHAAGDGGGGLLFWDSGSSATEDGGLVFRQRATISDATNASPIVITATGHGLANGNVVEIQNVGGNTAANGTWTIGNVTANTFSLTSSAGNGTYTPGTGTVSGPGRWRRQQIAPR